MIMDEHLIINLRVADMRYPLKVKRKDEEIYRKAADEIDYKLGQYKNYFTGGGAQPLQNSDYMAMTAIQALSEKVEQQFRAESFESKVKKLNQELEIFLKKHIK